MSSKMSVVLAALSYLVWVVSAVAEDSQLNLVNAGWLQASSRGEGVELIFMVNPAPEGGMEVLEQALLPLCMQVGPDVVAQVLTNMNKSEPDFIAITVRSGNAVFGSYVRSYFSIVNGVCGEEI